MGAKGIMVQGTASSVGKSLITAGLCRIFRQDGYRVVPFKSQNMALNSFITADGMEMGRAQVVQAEAAGAEPDVRMNPVLLKPTTDKKAQVIINGKVHSDMSAEEYHAFKPRLRDMIKTIYGRLASENDIIVIEGAGSPAEINLKDRDIVNMGMAELAGTPVLLVGDIDRGGVFASLAGTMMLLSEDERRRVKGIIINKFRGDIEILKPGIEMIENITGVPVIGVIPYTRFAIDDEDSVCEKLSEGKPEDGCQTDIAVIRLPHISNFTDLNALEHIPGVRVRYVEGVQGLGSPDLVVLPGTKNTVGDLLHLRTSGLEEAIILLNGNGTPVFGICGGYQMLGTEIRDPHGVESNMEEVAGMGLMDVVTVMQEQKRTVQVDAEICRNPGILEGTQGLMVKGYEIHMGRTSPGSGCKPFSTVYAKVGGTTAQPDGACSPDGKAAGTYIHGIFDNNEFALHIINNLRRRKGLHELDGQRVDHRAFKQAEYDRLAQLLREHLDIARVYEIINTWREGAV